MSDTSVTTEAPSTTTSTTAPVQNDMVARSPTGEILDVRDLPKETPKAEETTQTSDTTSADSSQPKPEDKPAEAKPEAKPAEGVPEKYEFKAPDGITVSDAVIAEATPIFKELGLNQDQANKLFDFYTKQQQALIAAPQEAFNQTVQKWKADTAAHPDIKATAVDGKVGTEAVSINVGRALSALGNEALITDFKLAMNSTGVGDHPAFVRAMNKFGQLLGEGKNVTGGGPSPHGQGDPRRPANPGPAASMYPNHAKASA